MEIWQFKQKQSLPYSAKILHAVRVAKEYRDIIQDEYGGELHVSVGGLDSLTLYFFLKEYVDKDIKAVSVSRVEQKGVRAVHKQLGVINVKPYKNQITILNEYGFPVISKEKAKKIEMLLTPANLKQTFIHAIMTGDMGEQGKYQHCNKIKLPDKWIRRFGGLYNEHRPELICFCPNFKVSAECCYWMKEKPIQDWAKEHNSYPYLGLMASEGGQREKGLIKNGCNYFGKSTIRSCPFAPFYRQDLLRLALDLNVPVPEEYGEIKERIGGQLFTTKAQRTGCDMCGFGIHIEARPHRFDRLRDVNPKAWHFWMYECVTDKITGEKYGWGRVLDWIGVGWEDIPFWQTKVEDYMPRREAEGAIYES